MSRIYDYNAFSSANKSGQQRGDYSFGAELKYVDIDIHNRPEEYQELDDSKAFIEYSVNVGVKKDGIDSLDFKINSVELEFTVDDYPNPPKEFDIDLIPGKTIDIGQVLEERKTSLIPTRPTRLSVDMNASTDPKKFNVTVYFGTDEQYY